MYTTSTFFPSLSTFSATETFTSHLIQMIFSFVQYSVCVGVGVRKRGGGGGGRQSLEPDTHLVGFSA